MMTPDINIMRQEVVNLYPKAPKWRKRVNQMDDAQVTAIYFNRIASKAAEEAAKDKKDEPDIPF